ncbi:hypothetical protein DBB36_11815 [Flavobacterium sp. WLB]|uniref:hypothetical protein n=1 Tax=unclassified Flavobacterium TaxID=196869 RepID=UPI0006ABDB1F|nr:MULTISPECIES: hypothetical protein [unclassified Flavobacterium]KOP37434.1 hypothetical protein AKO67_14340 [Flavobacterium sp. VMW]OWU92466.1 hypothetical protein APR43_04305 [Flavobacterium sp. NLM]PUU69833.1 hypothetical protein DBB36_11815 [Flavobacterium sp. WLB]
MNPKIKGFPLLSGLGHKFPEENFESKRHFHKKKRRKNRNLAPLRLCEIKKNKEKTRFHALAPSRQNQAERSQTAKIPNKDKTTKKKLPCKKRITSAL